MDEFNREGQMGWPSSLPDTSGRNDAKEMDLASRLLAVTGDAELERVIGSLMVPSGGKSSALHLLKSSLKRLARRILPALASSAIGTRRSDHIASNGARIFGLELEGLSPEDQEFEIARRFVRLAAETGRKAQEFSHLPPHRAAQTALAVAARRLAPGLPITHAAPLAGSGQWIRQGHKIIVF